MPYWMVSEPGLALNLRDKPFYYNTSRGREVAMELHFKNSPGANGAVDTAQPGIFGVGTNWHIPWRSYLQRVTNSSTVFFGFLGDGSARQYVLNAPERTSRITLAQDEETNTFYLRFPSGSINEYGERVFLGDHEFWFLTKKIEPQGNALEFEYTFTANSARLDTIRDADNREITFLYTNGSHYGYLLAQVQGPYGLTVTLGYDSQDRLTNIVDVAGLSAQLVYDGSQRLSKLITPYGTNSFAYFGASPGWTALHVTELDVRKHLYLEGFETNNMLPNAQTESVALATFLGDQSYTESLETNNFDAHNTFYWGPRQFQNLSTNVQAALTNDTFAPANLTTNDLQLGWTRHWLRALNTNTVIISDCLTLLRAPSPDASGTTEGLLTWYDYAGKPSREFEGTTRLPRCQASREPGGPWRVILTDYNPLGFPTAITDNYSSPTNAMSWRTREFSYAGNGIDLAGETLDGASVATYSYNAYHQVVSHKNALNAETTYAYSGSVLSSLTRPNGLVTEYTYTDGWLTSAVDSSGGTALRTNSFTYTNGYVWTQTDERGLALTNVWDALGRLTRTIHPDGTGITNVYTNLDLVVTCDRMGFTDGYAYNGFRELIRHTNAMGKVTYYGYCDCGGLESITDPLNQTTIFTLDNAGRRTRTTYPDNAWTENTYNLQGQVVRLTDSAGIRLTNFYTVNGLLFTASNAFGRAFYREFDHEDRLTTSIDANGVSTRYEYDEVGRLVHRVFDRVAYLFYAYAVPEDYYQYTPEIAGPTATYRQYRVYLDESLTELGFSCPFGERVDYTYDPFGRKTLEVHSAISGDWGETTTPIQTNTFTYSAAGDLLSLTDGKSQVTTWQYDSYGHVTNKTDAASNVLFRYQFDANGRLTSRWTPGTNAATGITTTYSYNAGGDLTQINYPTSPDITLHYDTAGRLTNMVDGVGSTLYTYTASGAVASEDGPWASDTVSYTYTNRLRAAMSLQVPNTSAWAQGYGYDPAGRLSEVSSPAGAFAYGYHPGLATNGAHSPTRLVQSLTLPNGAAITNGYDAWARLLSTHLRDSAETLLNGHAYTYNDLDQRTNQTRLGSPAWTNVVAYTYDALGQLVGANGKEPGDSSRVHEQMKYEYDAAGNLAKRTNNALVQTFSVNSLNELTSVGRSGTYTVAGAVQGTASSVTVNGSAASLYADQTFAKTSVSLADGTNTFTAVATDSLGRWDTNTVTSFLPTNVTFGYDLNGNLRTNGTRLFDYDDENQLTRITEPGAWRSDFTYDGKMRRRERWESVWNGTAWVTNLLVRYVYNGNVIIQERHYNPQLSTLNPQLLVTYTRGNDLSGSLEGAGGIGGLLARTEGPSALDGQLTTAFYHADGNGNITCLLDTNQTVVARYLYDPFGNLLAATGPLAEANLYRFSSKELHPASGLVYYLYRFYATELQTWLSRDPLQEEGGVNLHAILANNPIDDFDPDGLARHKKKRPSTHDKHTNPRPGRPTTKQRCKPGWVDAKTGKVVGPDGRFRCFPGAAGLAVMFAVDAVCQEIPDPELPDDDGKCPFSFQTPVTHKFLWWEWVTCEPPMRMV